MSTSVSTCCSSAGSSQLKNSHRAAPSCSMAWRIWVASAALLRDLNRVLGLSPSISLTPPSTWSSKPQVTRAGSTSRHAVVGNDARAVCTWS
ncbi:hypothetical protein D3C71_1770100 [compost metagenome]